MPTTFRINSLSQLKMQVLQELATKNNLPAISLTPMSNSMLPPELIERLKSNGHNNEALYTMFAQSIESRSNVCFPALALVTSRKLILRFLSSAVSSASLDLRTVSSSSPFRTKTSCSRSCLPRSLSPPNGLNLPLLPHRPLRTRLRTVNNKDSTVGPRRISPFLLPHLNDLLRLNRECSHPLLPILLTCLNPYLSNITNSNNSSSTLQ